MLVLNAALLATWFGWSVRTFGPAVTFTSNSSVTMARQYQGNGLARTAANLWDLIVPTAVGDPEQFLHFRQAAIAGFVRDVFFVSYQANCIFMLGVVGGPLALWLLFRRTRGRGFWVRLVVFCIVVGISSAGERDRFGLAHLTLLPLAAMGLALLAGAFPWRRTLGALLVAGCLIDFAAGILLHVHCESREAPAVLSLSTAARANWTAKHRADQPGFGDWFARQEGRVPFLGDHFAPVALFAEALAVAGAGRLLRRLAAAVSRG